LMSKASLRVDPFAGKTAVWYSADA
jgi:hypothetical protein